MDTNGFNRKHWGSSRLHQGMGDSNHKLHTWTYYLVSPAETNFVHTYTDMHMICMGEVVTQWRGTLLESIYTVLTQPGTLASFQGMFIYLLFNFWKLQIFQCFPFLENSRTPTFPISGNSRLRCFPRFLYYVITLISRLHLSLVTPSAVVSTSLSPDPQFPFALLYCFCLCNSDPLLCTWYKLVPFLSYKYLYSAPRSSELRLLWCPPSRSSFLPPLRDLEDLSPTHLLIISTRYSFLDPEIPESGIPMLPHTQKSRIPEGFHREQGNTCWSHW